MKTLLLISSIMAAFSLHGQIHNAETYRQNAVMIRTTDENGSGFICSKQSDSVFVLSAHHVIEHARGDITITVADGRTVPGRVVFTDPGHDLVVIGLKINNLTWTPVPVAPDVELGDRVYYITLLEADKPLLPRNAIATIDKWDSDGGFQYASVRGVSDGDSGAALLCSNGIAGIILTQQVKSLDIQVARAQIEAWDKTKWQLASSR